MTPAARVGEAAAGHRSLPVVPAVVSGRVRHERFGPVRHAFSYRVHQWLVDVDRLDVVPRWLRPLASFAPRDHLGSGTDPLRAKVEHFLREQGVEWSGGRILMLANARCLGYVFDPLSVFWLLDDDGEVAHVLAEVHNTYGERHTYLLRPDEAGRDRTDKQLYVSPFFEVSGEYRLRFALRPSRIGVDVVLQMNTETVFSASFHGRPRPVTSRRTLAAAVRQPLMPQRVSLLIRLHGVWLWVRRLPVVRRAPHRTQRGMQ